MLKKQRVIGTTCSADKPTASSVQQLMSRIPAQPMMMMSRLPEALSYTILSYLNWSAFKGPLAIACVCTHMRRIVQSPFLRLYYHFYDRDADSDSDMSFKRLERLLVVQPTVAAVHTLVMLNLGDACQRDSVLWSCVFPCLKTWHSYPAYDQIPTVEQYHTLVMRCPQLSHVYGPMKNPGDQTRVFFILLTRLIHMREGSLSGMTWTICAQCNQWELTISCACTEHQPHIIVAKEKEKEEEKEKPAATKEPETTTSLCKQPLCINCMQVDKWFQFDKFYWNNATHHHKSSRMDTVWYRSSLPACSTCRKVVPLPCYWSCSECHKPICKGCTKDRCGDCDAPSCGKCASDDDFYQCGVCSKKTHDYFLRQGMTRFRPKQAITMKQEEEENDEEEEEEAPPSP